MATDKQLGYYTALLSDLGESISDQELEAFARLSVREASAKITELEQKRFSQPTEATAGSSKSEEPE